MLSVMSTGSSGYKKGEVPFDQYEWGPQPFWMALQPFGKGDVGTKRVETKRFIRLEYLRVSKKENGYKYRKSSHWFIKFPFCKNDQEIFRANAVVWVFASALSIAIANGVGRVIDSLAS